ncbi:alpha/beta hydrolase [Arenimonas sp. MALMAid1274]|uniref:alpha/beta hydrolase n=1 Tax=Arenimonas sp. MALMAid1274 TaxID=3411630 RepID=UPI003BA0C11E
MMRGTARAQRKRRLVLATMLALPLLAYLALCLLMYGRQQSLVYFPQGTRMDAVHTDYAIKRDGVALRGWLINPGQADALIYFGGNAEAIEGMRTRLSRWFPDRSIYLLAYRGYGASDGEPDEAALVGDGLALFDHVRSRHRQGDVALIGRSLGSGVASQVAAQRPVKQLVLVTPFDSLAEVGAGHYPWLPVNWLLRDRYDSHRHLANFDGQVLVIRAGRDQVVPPVHTNRLIAALPKAPEVVDVAEASHDTVLSGDVPVEAMARFLAR